MSSLREHEPTIATVAVYTLGILNQIKRREKVFPQEWAYLQSHSSDFLDEILMELDSEFAPSEAARRQHQMKSLTEISWQFERVGDALKAMKIIPRDSAYHESAGKMADVLMLFKSLIEKISQEHQYPKKKKLKTAFEQYRHFLYHLCGVSTGVYTMEVRRLLDAA